MMPLLCLALIAAPTMEVVAPAGGLSIRVALDAKGRATLAVLSEGRPLLEPGGLGLDLASGGRLAEGLRVLSVKRRTVDETYAVPAGKTSRARNRFNEATVQLQEAPTGRRFGLIVRAYDDGAAFRYFVPRQSTIDRFDVREELTEFRPVGNPKAYVLTVPHFRTPYESLYTVGPLAALRSSTLVGFPLLLEYPDRKSIALTEADLTDYPGLYVTPEGGGLTGRLSPRLDTSGLAVKAKLPHATPWRVVMVAARPERLIESNLIENLNPPNAIKDTSWIRPGKTSFPWWNSYDTGDTGIQEAQTTEYHKWAIDFDAAHGIPYHSLDGLLNVAWYGGLVGEYRGERITQALPGLDLPEVLRYAKSKGVRIRLWANSQAVKAQMAVAFPLYERWGIEGVMVDFFDRDDQDTVNLVHNIVTLAAKHHLTVTLHNVFKPTGLSRTYPNLLTYEAARNLEFDKWEAEGVTPEHELIVPFVRMLAGPVDFHSGSFRNVLQSDFKPLDKRPVTIGTRARQLARYVVYEGALPMVADSPAAYKDQPGLDFLSEVPTTWDETRALMGEVGEYLVIARRKGRDWYLGAMTDGQPRTLEVPLGFLGKGRYRMQTCADAVAPTELAISKGEASSTETLTIRMSAAGGMAAHFIAPAR